MILTDIVEEEQYSHIVLGMCWKNTSIWKNVTAHLFTSVTEGTLENMIQMDYIIEQFSKVKVYNMKPADPQSSCGCRFIS